MANFNKRTPTQQPQQPAVKQDQQSQVATAPALEVAQPVAVAAEGLKEIAEVPTSKENDDAEMQTHPRKDYQLADHANRVNGKRELQGDIFCRQLNCTMFMVEVHKSWGPNPYGGAPVDVTYTREFPEKQILFDNFDMVPSEAILNLKRDMAHEHGYRYLHQYPSVPLTIQELDRQLKLEEAFFKSKGK